MRIKYYSGGQIKNNEMEWACSTYGERRGAYRILVGKLEGKNPLRKRRRRWEESIETDLREMGWRRVDWIDFFHDRDRWLAFVNAVMNLRVL